MSRITMLQCLFQQDICFQYIIFLDLNLNDIIIRFRISMLFCRQNYDFRYLIYHFKYTDSMLYRCYVVFIPIWTQYHEFMSIILCYPGNSKCINYRDQIFKVVISRYDNNIGILIYVLLYTELTSHLYQESVVLPISIRYLIFKASLEVFLCLEFVAT